MCAQFKISTRPRKESAIGTVGFASRRFDYEPIGPVMFLAMSMNGASESGF